MNVLYGWTHFAWVLAIAFSALVVLLAGFPLMGQAIRLAVDHYSKPLRAALDRRIAGLLDGSIDYDAGLRMLREHARSARRAVLDRLGASAAGPDPEHLATLRRLATDLGLVDLWRRQAVGQSVSSMPYDLGLRPRLLERIPGLGFVTRAEAAENLGHLRDQASGPVLAQALDDPHPAVRSAAARALGRIGAPASFPALARKLEDAALGRGETLSVRTLRMALANFDVAHTSHLAEMLQHPHRRVRFLATDVIATMLSRTGQQLLPESQVRNTLPDRVAGICLSSLSIDPNPDVRARAADVIVHLNDPRTVPALLALLEDSEWFVRLHATRALAKCRIFPLKALGHRLTDTNWRVREAAAQVIGARGQEGVKFLLAHFRATDDRYSREQVVEQLERAGLIPSLLTAFDPAGGGEETRFIPEMVRVGRTAVLRSTVGYESEHNDAMLGELPDQDDLRDIPGTTVAAAQVDVLPSGGRRFPRAGREELRRA